MSKWKKGKKERKWRERSKEEKGMKRQWMVLVGHVDQRERKVIINVSLFEALRRGLDNKLGRDCLTRNFDELPPPWIQKEKWSFFLLFFHPF